MPNKVWDKNYSSIPELPQLHRLRLRLDMSFHLTVTFYNESNYFSMLALKLIHISKRDLGIEASAITAEWRASSPYLSERIRPRIQLLSPWLASQPPAQYPDTSLLTATPKRQYRKTSSMSHTKSQNLNVSHFVLSLSSPNPVKPGVKSRMKM